MLAAVYRGLPSKGAVDGRVGGPGVSFRRLHVLRFMFCNPRSITSQHAVHVSLSLAFSRWNACVSGLAHSRTTARGLNFR